jgi:hypothetical protein
VERLASIQSRKEWSPWSRSRAAAWMMGIDS